MVLHPVWDIIVEQIAGPTHTDEVIRLTMEFEMKKDNQSKYIPLYH